jgi:L-alanine-DL-glutamate epimerase-like enolase superfamily enzyme
MYLADLVLGQDVTNHEALWQRMYRTTVRFGRRGPVVAAISAIDNACWDAHGNMDNKSVVDLLGGPAQTKVPCYVSRLYALEDLDELADEARGYVQSGFKSLKQRFGFGPRDGYEGMRRNVELVATVREAVGQNIEIAADAYMGWDIGYSIEMAHRLRELNMSWIEEPLMPEQARGYKELRARVPWQRWSHGEHSYTKWDFAEIIQDRTSDILQIDVNRVGGLTEARKICALAETAGVPVVPHSNEIHNLALVFSQSAHVCPAIEYFPDVEPDTGNELFWKLFRGNPSAVDGSITLKLDQPGLGVQPDEDLIKKILIEDGTWSRV